MAGRHTVIIEIGEKVQQNEMCLYYLRKHCSVILLQMVMVCAATHLAKKNYESKCRTIESQFKKIMTPKQIFLGAFM